MPDPVKLVKETEVYVCRECAKPRHYNIGDAEKMFCSKFCEESYMKRINQQEGPKQGDKSDSGKQGWHSMPLSVLVPLAAVFEFGKTKYDKFNCLQPFENGDERLYNGMMRHVEASQINPLAINEEDGGVYHLAQVAFNALIRLNDALNKEADYGKKCD